MSDSITPIQQREFRCEHCKGLIRIPATLPPTTGPCPHCSKTITSPGPDEEPAAARKPFPGEFPGKDPVLTKGPKIRHEDDESGEEHEEESQDSKRPYLAAVIGLLAVILAVAIGGFLAMREMRKTRAAPKDVAVVESEAIREAQYIRTGWKKDAYQVLDGFMKGASAAEKLPYVLNGASTLGKMEAFYGNQSVNDSDTPAEAFSVFNLSEEDRKRGLFMLVFDQPPQFSMRSFFRPLASLEVQHGLAEADLLLTSMARVSNFAIDPMRVHAFFRRTPDGLKLDWEVFAQTKYALLRKFIEDPQIGHKAVFRVFVMEDVSDQRFSIVSSRTYRISDPANTDHTARILVPMDSEVGRQLSAINWVGIEGKRPDTRTATMELEWSGNENQPNLAIKRLYCWEFLGLGGGGNAAKPEEPAPGDP